METRSQRAWRDAKPWRLSRKDGVSSALIGVLVFLAQLVFLHHASVITLLISVGVVAAAAILIPLGVYAGSWSTAGGRILRDEMISLHEEMKGLKVTLITQEASSELLGRLKELKALADMLNRRLPPLAPPTQPLEQELEKWGDLVSEALVDLPEMRAQFVAATTENSLMTAFNASPGSIRFQIRRGILDTVIKFVAARDGVKE